MARLKTAILVNHTAALGGAEFALKRLLMDLNREEWNPVVVFGEDGPAAELVRQMSIETYIFPLGESLGQTRKDAMTLNGICSARRWGGLGSYVWKLSRFLKERAADVVHTNSMKAHILGGLAAKMAGIPLVWHIRDTVDSSYLPTSAVKLLRWLAQRLPDRVVTVSNSVARSLLGSTPTPKGRVIYDGLEDSAFDAPAIPQATPNWRVGMIGRLSAWKGQHVFIEAAALLLSKGLLIDFEILGNPMFGEQTYANGLSRQVSSLGLTSHVHFRGFVTDVGQRLRKWDVCVHASTSADPCPNVVLEAMGAGVPVVASAGGGVPELLEDGRFGDLFTMGSSAELASAIERLLLDRTRRITHSNMARERALQLYRSNRVAREVEEVWNAVVHERTWSNRRWSWIEDGFGRRRRPQRSASEPSGSVPDLT